MTEIMHPGKKKKKAAVNMAKYIQIRFTKTKYLFSLKRKRGKDFYLEQKPVSLP